MATVQINGQDFEIKPMRANEIAAVAQIVGRLSLDGRKLLRQAGTDPGDVIWALLAAVTGDELVKLAAVVVGCDAKFAADNFDLVWVTEALALQMNNINLGAILKNFTLLSTQLAS